MVKVQLIEDKPMAVSGQVTGRVYMFRNLNDTHWVDKRDAVSMKEVKELQLFS